MKPSRFLGTPLLILLFSAILLHISFAADTCHVDDLGPLLAFKSGITDDPSGMLDSWVPTVHCCYWENIACFNARVETINLAGNLDQPDSYLTGTISSSLSKLKYLTTIVFTNLRNLSGPFPEVVFRIPSLTVVRMDGNQLSGPLPRDIGNLTRIQFFSFGQNRFVGSIPSSISKMESLTVLVLSGNLLTGSIPLGIKMLKNLIELHLDENQLIGNIPDFFSSFTKLQYIYLSNNKLSGNIPPSVANLPTNLYFFEVGHNDLTGEIPSFFGNFQGLYKLDLSSNHFSGSIPKSFENMTELGVLDVSHNNLVGPLPKLNKDKVSEINLSYNRFHLGEVPEWIISAYSLKNVGLARCGIKMRLDDWKPESNTYYLHNIDISGNEISGGPIKFFNSTPLLEEFRASGNKLKFNMGKLKVPKPIKVMDLSRNLVFGKLPKSVGRIKNLNVSYNHLCGPIPATNNSAAAFTGNDCLCGSPLPPCNH